jgi:hypothetical protein
MHPALLRIAAKMREMAQSFRHGLSRLSIIFRAIFGWNVAQSRNIES